MLSLTVALSLFLFWFLVGRGFRVFSCTRETMEEFLLAPVFGMALTVLSLFLASFGGIPVARSAKPITLGLMGVGGILLVVNRPRLPRRAGAAFLTLAVASLLFTGRPALQFGNDWLSYVNGDMTNYCVRAQHLRDFPLREPPSLQDFLAGRDYCLRAWYNHAGSDERAGVELLQAWSTVLTGLNVTYAFMPLILSFHLVQLWAAAALVYRSARDARTAFCFALALAAATLYNLGTIYQLLAQVGGLALLCGAASMLFRPYRDQTTFQALEHGLWSALLLSAHLVVYPEAFPFLFLGLLLYLVAAFFRGDLRPWPLFVAAGTAAAATTALLNVYAPYVIRYTAAQFIRAKSDATVHIFPYYLLPTGPLNLWGLATIDSLPASGVWTTLKILGCIALLLTVIVLSVQGTIRGDGPHTVFVVMALVSIKLFAGTQAFGLFKLAMYIQPFLWGVLAVDWVAPRRVRGCALFVLLALWNLPQAKHHVDVSTGTTGSMCEIRDPSRAGIVGGLTSEMARLRPKAVVFDCFNDSMLNLILPHVQGVPTAIPNLRFQAWYGILDGPLFESGGLLAPDPAVLGHIGRTIVALRPCENVLQLDLHPGSIEVSPPGCLGRQASQVPGAYFVNSTGWCDIVNRRKRSHGDRRPFLFAPLKSVHNQLIYLKPPHRLGRAKGNYLYQLERDVLYPNRTFSAISGTNVFEVVNFVPNSRFLLDVTATLNADREALLSPVSVIGSTRVAMPWSGRGAARLYSPPVTVQRVDGRDLLALQLSGAAQQFQYQRTGLFGRLGTRMKLDGRVFHGFARDISLVTEAEYQRNVPPERLTIFPQSLMNPALEFYGIMEDGWISETAAFRLTQTKARSRLVIDGWVPNQGDPSFKTRMTVRVDEKEVAAREIGVTDFRFVVDLPAADGPHWIKIDSTRVQKLGVGDARPVAAGLRSAGFSPSH